MGIEIDNIVHITDDQIASGYILHTTQTEKDLWNKNAVSGDNLKINYNPTEGYTPASTTVSGHLSGIKDALNDLQIEPNPPGDSLSIAYSPTEYDETDSTVSGNLDGISKELGEIKTIQSTSLDGRSVIYNPDGYTTTGQTLSANLDGIGNELKGNATDIATLAGLSADIVWEHGVGAASGTIQPKISTNKLLLPYLHGNVNSIPVTNSSGEIIDSCSTLIPGPSGNGSVININHFETNPAIAELLPGDIWLQSIGTSGYVWRYYNGVSTQNVPIAAGGGGGAVSWGDILGTLANQTDLQNEFANIKQVPSGGTINQVLSKASSSDFDTEWSDVAAATGSSYWSRTSGGIISPSVSGDKLDVHEIETSKIFSENEQSAYIEFDDEVISIYSDWKNMVHIDGENEEVVWNPHADSVAQDIIIKAPSGAGMKDTYRFDYSALAHIYNDKIFANSGLVLNTQTLTGVTIGSSNNDKIPTQGYVDDAVGLLSGAEWFNGDMIELDFVPGVGYTQTNEKLSGHLDGIDKSLNSLSAAVDNITGGTGGGGAYIPLTGSSDIIGSLIPKNTGLTLGTSGNPWQEGYFTSGSLFLDINKLSTQNNRLYFNDETVIVSGDIADLESVYSNVNSNSGKWDGTYTTVRANSATWEFGSKQSLHNVFVDYSVTPGGGGSIDDPIDTVANALVWINSPTGGNDPTNSQAWKIITAAGISYANITLPNNITLAGVGITSKIGGTITTGNDCCLEYINFTKNHPGTGGCVNVQGARCIIRECFFSGNYNGNLHYCIYTNNICTVSDTAFRLNIESAAADVYCIAQDGTQTSRMRDIGILENDTYPNKIKIARVIYNGHISISGIGSTIADKWCNLINEGTNGGSITFQDIVKIPTGGTVGQVVTKASSGEYDVGWSDPGAQTFIDCADTPSGYVGKGNELVKVNAAEDAIEFSGVTIEDAPAGGSMLGLDIYTTEPTAPTGEDSLYAYHKSATVVELIITNGSDIYTVELTKR